MWKDIKGYEGLYQVSDEGNVRRILKSGNTKQVKCKDGLYYTVSLSKNGRYKSFNVHRLVAEAFLDRPEGKTEVNHIDGDKHNNNLSNLEWVTQQENHIHALEVLHHFPWGKPPRKVKCFDAETGNEIAEFHSISEAAKAIGKASARSGISLVCNGLQNTAYGYRWEYAD